MMRREYNNAIPSSRLGTRHDSFASYGDAVSADVKDGAPKDFSLVVLLSYNANTHDNGDPAKSKNEISSNISILLGKKLRGFGEGFYNCFGGKLERALGEHDHPAKGAVREVLEETGIEIPLPTMEDGFVGKVNFTFADDDVNKAMQVNLYCVFLELSDDDAPNDDSTKVDDIQNVKTQKNSSSWMQNAVLVNPKRIRGCDEIEPRWFHNIYDIPLDQMFADDSLWLTSLLSRYNDVKEGHTPQKLMFDAWFHFHPGGTKINSIAHHFIRINTNDTTSSNSPKYTFEKRLFHALHVNHIHSPSIKEFKENWAMANAVRKFMKEDERMEYVIDVAGGHGALGALFLLLVPRCRTAIVIDPAKCPGGKKGVRDAWSKFWTSDKGATNPKKELRYRHECLRTGLRKELDGIMKLTKCTNVTVVACHACQHLTDETLQIASEYGVNVAVAPCCQKDHDGSWKGVAKTITKSKGNNGGSLSIGALMDLLAAGKMMAWDTGSTAGVRYQVKMKLMDSSISLQNRMILCKATGRDLHSKDNADVERKKELAHEKLIRAYKRAHKLSEVEEGRDICVDSEASPMISDWCIKSLLTGAAMGAALSLLIDSSPSKKSS